MGAFRHLDPMAVLKTLLDRFLSKSPNQKRDAADNYQQLDVLKNRHSFIEVKFPRLEQSFQSMILELHPEDSYLLVDELYPPDGRQAVLEGDMVEISGRAPGVSVVFYSKLLLREVIDGNPAYRMELPDEIGATYRRHAYRVYVERETDLILDVRSKDGALIDVHIVNLSADGIKLSVRGIDSASLEREHLWEHSVIRLPSGIDVDCTIDIRTVYPMRSPAPHLLAGAKLEISSAVQRSKLDQYLATVQRRQRRREVRMS